MATTLEQIQAAVAEGKALAESVMNCSARFFIRGNPTPVLTCACRVKKPRPSAFEASDQTEWNTKRKIVIQIPQDVDLSAHGGVIPKGWVVQVSGANDPAVNGVTFNVESQLDSGFAYARNVVLETDATQTPRVP